MTAKVPITAKGAEKLREELSRLKTVDRPRIIQAIAEARAHGDLKENAEYHADREQQSFAEGRIKEIAGKLSHAHIVDVTTLDAKGKVVFGCTVELMDEDTEDVHQKHRRRVCLQLQRQAALSWQGSTQGDGETASPCQWRCEMSTVPKVASQVLHLR